MLSNIKKISSAKQAGSYYKKADYYTKGEDMVDISSSWFGKGADELGLEGLVDHKTFEAIMAGVLPDGTILDHHNRVIGWDLTFSAPKSASTLALVGGDNRLLEAHFDAVKATLKFAEEEFAITRKTENGETFIDKTSNYLAALFTHTTSRALDPALHTHSVLMNITKNSEDEWRAIESNPLFDNRMLLGLAYQNEFARRARELGYEPIRNDRTGQFDLAEVPRNVIDEFSQRRRTITEAANEQGVSLTDAKGMEQVTLNTRATKKNIPTTDVVANWDKRMSELDFDPQKIIEDAKEKSAQSIPENSQHDPLNIIKLAIENLSFKDSVFSRQNLIKETFRFDKFSVVLGDVGEHIDTLVSNNSLIETRKDELGQVRQFAYTTPASVDREREILGLVKSGVGQVQPMATHEQVADFIERYNAKAPHALNDEQQEALIGLAINDDRFSGLQGLPGVGKSTLMHAFNSLSNENGFKLVGIAPTGTAAQELYQKAKMHTRTIDSLLEIDKHRDKEDYLSEPNTVYLIDESGMVSDRHTVALMRLSTMSGSRMKDAGDINQIPAIEAGAPFEQKQKLAYSYEVMRNVQRQKAPILKKAVLEAIDNTITAALKTLKSSPNPNIGISNIENENERVEASVSHYERLLQQELSQGVSLADAVNDKVKMITPLNKTKDELNNAVRTKLLEHGIIDKTDTLSLLTLLPKGLSPTEQQQAIGLLPFKDTGEQAYGDIIRFHDDIKDLGIKQGEYYQVKQVKNTNVTLFNGERGYQTHINMADHKDDNLMTVFSASRKQIAVGEQLRWKDTYQTTDIRNGQSLEVLAFDRQNNTYDVKIDDGRTISLPNDLTGSHTNYNYAVTPHEIQGASIKYTIPYYDQQSKRLQTRNGLIVTLSRGEEGTYLYTDNFEKVAANADAQKFTKSSALDHIGQSGSYKNIGSPTFKTDVLEAKDGVGKAVEHLSAQFSAFNTHEIMRHAMRFSGQQTLPVKQAINEMIKANALLPVQTNDQNQTYYTSPAIVKQEKELRGYLKSGSKPINISEHQLSAKTTELGFHDETADALKNIFGNNHKLSLVNTKVNADASLFTHAMLDLAKLNKLSVALVSPSNQVQHAERLGRDVFTLAQYAKSDEKHDVVIVLDGHNASAQAFNRMLSKSTDENSKVFVYGLTAIAQGFAHKDALSNLAKNAKKTQYFDLTGNPIREVDILLSQTEGKIPDTVKKQLEREALVVQSEAQRHEKIVQDYLKKPDTSNVISASKEGVKSITNKIREELKKQGKITEAKNLDTLTPVFLSPQQKQVASEYKVGQIILFNRKGEKNGFTRQESYVVEKVDSQSNNIILRSPSGTHTVSVHELHTNGFSVAAVTKTEIGKGERIRFDTGIFEFKIHQNATAKVTDTHSNKNTLSVELDSGRKVELDLSVRAHQFISHGYTQSMNKSASMPMNQHALIELDGRFKSGANVQSFLKSLSNAKHSVSLYADKRSTVSNYLSPSKDGERNIDALLHRETQRSAAQAKAQESTQEHTMQKHHQNTQQENQHQHIQQRER